MWGYGLQVWLKGTLEVKQSICNFGTQNGSKPFYFPWFDLDSPLPWLSTTFLSCCCARYLRAFVRDWLIEAHAPAWIETAVLIKIVDATAVPLWSSFHEVLGLWFVGFSSPGFVGEHKVSEHTRRWKLRAKAAAGNSRCCNPACELRCSRQFWNNCSPLANRYIIQWRQWNAWTS